MAKGLVALAAASILAGGALAQEPLWFADVGEAEKAAKWGIPQTDAVGFVVACAEGEVALRPALYTLKEPAEPRRLRLVVDEELFVRDLVLEWSERDAAFNATARVSPGDPVIAALRRGSSVTYDFDPPMRPDDAFTLPLSGSAKAIDIMLDAC